jgi:cytochrome c-type biogenesis protein CcmH/NrfF
VGSLAQVAVAIGVIIPSTIGLFYDYDHPKDNYNFARIIWGAPVIFLLLQTILMLTVYKSTTPTELKKAGKMDELRILMAKIYTL